jgi:hypothetical protein
MILGHHKGEAKAELNRFKKITYYRQGGAIKPLYVSYPWKTCFELQAMNKKVPYGYDDAVGYIEGDFMTLFLSTEQFRKVSLWYMDKYRQDKNFIHTLFTSWLSKEA